MKWKAKLDKLKREALSNAADASLACGTVSLAVKGWFLILDCQEMDSKYWYHLSAAPHPERRAGLASAEKDRRWMETFISYLGAPLMKGTSTPSSIRWNWMECPHHDNTRFCSLCSDR